MRHAMFLGAIVYYVWGMLAWMALPLHTPTIAGLPNEAEITNVLVHARQRVRRRLPPTRANGVGRNKSAQFRHPRNTTAGTAQSLVLAYNLQSRSLADQLQQLFRRELAADVGAFQQAVGEVTFRGV